MATRTRGRRQLQFTGVEMTLLAVSFLVTAAFVFCLGFYVGKKNAAAHVPREERVARIPVDDFSKYSRPGAAATAALTADEAAAEHGGTAKAGGRTKAGAEAGQKGDPKAPAKGGVAKADAKTDPKSDAKADSKAPGKGADATADPKAIAAATAAGGDAAKAAAADPHAQGPAPAGDDSFGDGEPGDAKAGPDAKAAAAKATATDAKAEAKADGEAKPEAKPDEEERKPGAAAYTVQVLATRKQADAEALVKKLSARGYGAYIKRVSDGQTSWYRVRVGRYGAFGEARTMADRCRRELGLEQAFVSTE